MRAIIKNKSAKLVINKKPFFPGKNASSFFQSNDTENELVQPKLNVGKSNDKYEVEANQMADSVVSSIESSKANSNDISSSNSLISRKPFFGNQNSFAIQHNRDFFNTETIQKNEQVENHNEEVDNGFENEMNQSTGSPIDSPAKNEMEAGFGADFSHVNIHAGTTANNLSSDIGAQAFTHGNDIYFNENKYQPDTNEGKHLLAHELTHTIQQTGGIQKVPAKTANSTAGATASTTNFFENKKTGISIDTNKKNITIPTLMVPAFKHKFGPKGSFTILAKVSSAISNEEDGVATDEMTSGRTNDQISIWQQELQKSDAQKFKTDLNDKVAKENAPEFMLNKHHIYYFRLKKAKKGDANTTFGIIYGTLTDIRQRLFRPYWDFRGTYVKQGYDVDHKVELQLGGSNDISNMWLLEAASNRSSGSRIKQEKVKRISKVLVEAKKANVANLPDKDKARKEYSLTITKGLSKGLGAKGSKKAWEIGNIKQGKQLNGLTALNEEDVAKLGLRGAADKLTIYSGSMGGIKNDIPWDDAASQAKKKVLAEQIFIGRTASGGTRIKEVHYDPASKNDGKLVCSVNFNKSKQKKYQLVNQLNDVVFTLKRSDAVQFGGYISKPSIADALKDAVSFKGLSPIQINQVGLDPKTGISAIGKIKPTVPLISKADIGIILDSQGIRVQKIFDIGEFDFPEPFKISNATVEISVGTGGFKFKGNLDFGIKNVGEGSLNASIDSNGNIKLGGKFNIASDLFEKSEVSFTYERTSEGESKYSISGKIVVGKGKVKGLKKAEADVSYKDNILSAKGFAEPDIKGFKQIEMFLLLKEDGYTFGGAIKLAGLIPKVKEGELELTVSKGPEGFKVSGGGSVVPDIPGLQAGTKITIHYNDGAILIQGELPFKLDKAKANGKINVGLTNQVIGEDGKPTGEIADEWTVFGKGNVSIALGKGIVAEAEVELKPNGHIIVSGKVGLDKSKDSPTGMKKEFKHTLFEIGPPPIVLMVIPPIGASLMLEIKGGARLYASFIAPHIKELTISIVGFNLTEPDENTEIGGKLTLSMSGKAGFELYLSLTAKLRVTIAVASGTLEGSVGLEANGNADASIGIKWSKANGLVIEKGEISLGASAQFLAKLKGRLRLYLDLWLAEIDIWNEELDIASIKFGDQMKVALKLPVSMKDGELSVGEPNKDSFEFPDLSSDSKQQELVEQGAKQDEKVKPPPPPSKEEAIAAVKKLSSGEIKTWTAITMDADEARARVALGWISRDTYIFWLRTKHPKLDWSEVVAVGRQKDRAEFEQLKNKLPNVKDSWRHAIIAKFKKEHILFTRNNKKEINEFL